MNPARQVIASNAPFGAPAAVAATPSAPPQDFSERLKFIRSASLKAGGGNIVAAATPLSSAGGASGFERSFGVSDAPSPALFGASVNSADDVPTSTCTTIPTDWRILTSVRVTSPWPLAVATTPCNTPRAISNCGRAAAASAATGAAAAGDASAGRRSFASDVTAAEMLMQGRVYWSYPDSPLPSVILALKARQEADVVNWCRDRLSQWLACLRSAYDAVTAGTMDYFYVLVSGTGC